MILTGFNGKKPLSLTGRVPVLNERMGLDAVRNLIGDAPRIAEGGVVFRSV